MYQGISFWNLLLVVQLAHLPGGTQEKTVIRAEAGKTVELPCQASQTRNMPFSWKYSDNRKILESQTTFLARGQSDLLGRVDSKKAVWDKGSFPLVINKLEVKDSNTYICEVENKKMEVELLVFKVAIHPDTSLLQGQSLTLTLESPVNLKSPMECKRPGNRNFKVTKDFSVPSLGIQDSGTWHCTLVVAEEPLVFNITILVLGFQSASTTDYKVVGDPVEFSFPLIVDYEKLNGEIQWQAEKASSPESWTIFSLENKKVTVKKTSNDPKVELAEKLPLRLKLPKALPHYAGSGNLTLTLAKGKLHHQVNLVVMNVSQSQDTLLCKVWGPTSPKMKLTLKLENQKDRISEPVKEVKEVRVLAPEEGMWHCLLSEGDKIWVDSKFQVLPKGLNQDQPMFLAAVLGGTFGFLVFSGLCILCCVKRQHQRRRAERMSQIKRLLIEKKTCQCHRLP